MKHTMLASSDGGSWAVSTRALSKRYGAKPALDKLELRVPEGAVYVLVGANGAGKSTAFRVLMNLARADEGTAEVFGLDTAKSASTVRAQIGYVPDLGDHGYDWMKCGALLQHAAAYYPTWDHAYAAGLCREFDLDTHARVGSLSKGAARRLHLVLALSHRPPLLLLDEPTEGLDPLVRKRALSMLAEHLADTPTTVVISTHQVHELESLADHLGVLRNGKLVAQMSRDDLSRTVHRYRVEVPEGWNTPPEFLAELRLAEPRRIRTRGEMQWTLVGEQSDVVARITLAGGQVREVTSLGLEDATLSFLEDGASS